MCIDFSLGIIYFILEKIGEDMATASSFDEQVKNKEPDFLGRPQLEFCWKSGYYRLGRVAYVTHPYQGPRDASWWVWSNEPFKTETNWLKKIGNLFSNKRDDA